MDLARGCQHCRRGSALRRQDDRFPHQGLAPKGVTKDDGWTDVGAGVIDWGKAWPAIARTGVPLLVMENDNPSDWRSFAANSYKYVSGLTGRG